MSSFERRDKMLPNEVGGHGDMTHQQESKATRLNVALQ